jgi:thiol-disulfide isomerase/thioredoxin
MFFILTFGLFTFHFTGRTALPQAKNDKAPSFTLKLLNGGDLKSSDLKGKVTVLKFVASYWPECRQEAPAVEKVYRAFKNKDVQFVGIFVRDRESEVQKFVQPMVWAFLSVSTMEWRSRTLTNLSALRLQSWFLKKEKSLTEGPDLRAKRLCVKK